MNDKECVKENTNPAKAKELASVILNCNIADQNEIIDKLRRLLADERMSYIEGLKSNMKSMDDQITYAETSLKSVIIGEIK
jgi:glycine cleavage system regulatory protein